MEINAALLAGVCIPVGGALLGFAIAWGAHEQKIKQNRDDIQELKEKFDTIDKKLDSIATKVARIDGRLNGKI